MLVETDDENLLLLCDNDLDNVEAKIEKYDSEVVIIDSIQTMAAADIDNAPGTVTQVREVTSRLLKLAKTHNTAIFIVGHVTKDPELWSIWLILCFILREMKARE